MSEKPVPVAISAVINEGRILLIKRARGDYTGLWALPGGKVQGDEHLSEAAVREILEETGIKAEFSRLLGTVSEHLVENGSIQKHLLLHVCELAPMSTDLIRGQEGQLRWFDLDHLEKARKKLIPSDFQMIEKLVRNRKMGYYNCVIEKSGRSITLKKFE
jgi:8-oxo-dGTP diphosphatase